MQLKRELLPDLPEEIELPEDEETLIDGWVEQIARNNKSAQIRLDVHTIAQLNLRDVTPKNDTSPPQNMKDILAPYDRIKVAVKRRNKRLEVAFSMENEIQVGDVNWSIITEGAHFYEPDEIQGSEERCAECRQLLRLPTRKLKENLFTEFARKVADVSKKIDDIPGEKGLTMNQLRNFYDVIKTTQDRLMQVHNLQKREDEFRLEKPRLKLLFSKVVNAQRRGNIPKVFAKFMDECLEIVTKEDAKYHDFEAFVLTFEAVAGYFGKDE